MSSAKTRHCNIANETYQHHCKNNHINIITSFAISYVLSSSMTMADIAAYKIKDVLHICEQKLANR